MSLSRVGPPQGHDEFGLPRILLIGELFESAEHKAKRTKKVEAFAKRAFNAVADQMGHEAAAHVFAGLAKRKPKTAGRKKQVAIDDDVYRIYSLERRYCIEYDDEKSIPSLPRRISDKLHVDRPGVYGPSAQAIEQRIWRILRARNPTFPH